ncbi:hypothetical protein [Tunturiibacter gelidiferens]|uniref:Uncharacterized protein n=1 Tax=Tunturiibacter gelidiferens TaxID=3069689 RepID=A0AAU7YVL9_9BACT
MIFQKRSNALHLAHFVLAGLSSFAWFSPWNAKAETPDKVSIDLHKVVGAEHACALGQRSVQFISEEELLLQAGPTEKCYQSVSQLELIVISLDGHILARKPWPSTFSTIVLPSKRIALSNLTELQVVNDRLATIQVLPLPDQAKSLGGFLSSESTDRIRLAVANGTLVFGGTPLLYLRFDPRSEIKPGEPRPVYAEGDGRQLVLDGSHLSERGNEGTLRKIADLSWVIPCDKYCQAYDAGTAFEVVTTKERRILVISNGSRFPVTDAAGLFPYFRLAVFDLDTGAEIYREQFVTKTGERSAALSPEGDLLATFSGDSISIRKLKH